MGYSWFMVIHFIVGIPGHKNHCENRLMTVPQYGYRVQLSSCSWPYLPWHIPFIFPEIPYVSWLNPIQIHRMRLYKSIEIQDRKKSINPLGYNNFIHSIDFLWIFHDITHFQTDPNHIKLVICPIISVEKPIETHFTIPHRSQKSPKVHTDPYTENIEYIYIYLSLSLSLALSHPKVRTVYSIQYTVYSIQYTVYSIQYTVYSIQYTVYSIQYTVYSIQYTVYSIQYTVYSTYIHT